MNIFKKIYCRVFQTVFKIAIPILPYRNPVILNSVQDIPKQLKSKEISCVLLVTDKSIRQLGISTQLESLLKDNNIKCVIYDETVANPTVKNVEDARALYIKNNCRGIIGFGGGSPIDCAKIVGARVVRPNKSISQMKGILKICKKLPLLMAVPSTAGTGSETTLAAVITDGHKGHKFPINDFSLIPHCAVLDPAVTKTLPPHLTATTGMDAITHAVEAYIGRSTVKSTRSDAIEAVKLIDSNLEKAYNDGNNMEARSNMLYASFLAGRAFSKSYVGYCHAVAHSLGGKYNIPHGLANAVLLPHVLKSYLPSKYACKKLKELAIAINLVSKDTSDRAAAEAFINRLETMNKKMGITKKFDMIQKSDIPILAAYAEKEANPLYPVPILMTKEELQQFYYAVME
ncbi:MAG: iron-containing alcohol dehydrogenase [Clostridia bacterium]|nr:iron-containing alcohol dehydrogenase [Clostridia bacterium]